MREDLVSLTVINRLSRTVNCDAAWLASFLRHCTSEEDGRQSILALRRNCPEKFRRKRGSEVRVGRSYERVAR